MGVSNMKNVYFKSIIIADLQSETARSQTFEKGFNVITSADNHVGKSSLLKSLYYTLGAEVKFDSVWTRQPKLYVLSLDVDGKEYCVARFGKNYAVFEDDELLKITDSVSKELAPLIGEIFGFSVYLPNKKTKKIEMAPPAFMFLPYYIDQDKGWNNLYGSFESIDQYQKDDRIKSLYYHLNIYTKETIQLMAKRDLLKEQEGNLQSEINRLKTIVEALQEEIGNLPPAEDEAELEVHLEIPKERIEKLVEKIGKSRNQIQKLETALYQHKCQLRAIKKQTVASSRDVSSNHTKFQVCPNCGYILDEEIFDIVRTNYGAANKGYMCKEVQLLIESLSEKLRVEKKNYVELNHQLESDEKIFDEEKNEYNTYLRQRGLRESIRRFQNQLTENIRQGYDLDQEAQKIKKELSKLPTEKQVEEKYIENARLNIMKLGAWDSAYDGQIRLLKPIKAQGTLENKIILAQSVALFETMEDFKSSATRFPFVVDSPRAKEASVSSSQEIISMIAQLKMLPQVILATIDYEKFNENLPEPAKIISLTEPRALLNKVDFMANRQHIMEIADLLMNHDWAKP